MLSPFTLPPRSTLFPYTTLFRSLGAPLARRNHVACVTGPGGRRHPDRLRRRPGPLRSEEHTSELQSHVNLVCRLLLEKKKSRFYASYHKRQSSRRKTTRCSRIFT